MSSLLLPNTPSGRMASQSLNQMRDQRAATAIAKSSKSALSSDEFLSHQDIARQIERLVNYITSQGDAYRIPMPVGWRVSFLILQPPEKTAGGLELPEDVTEAYAHKSMQGIVLNIGETAYKDPERFPAGPWCEAGDRLIFKRYDAQVFELSNGQKIGIINDTQPIAVIDKGWLNPGESNV